MEDTMANKNGDKQSDKKKTTIATVEPAIKVMTSKSGIIIIPGIKLESFRTLLMGTAPLICHNFSAKLRKQILDKHMGEASAGREKKDPVANFEAARYRLSDSTDGVPAGGIKAAFVKGFNKASGVPQTKAKGAIRVLPDDVSTNLVRILGPGGADWPKIRKDVLCVQTPKEAIAQNIWPNMREDVVRNESGVVDIRHRPEYWPWAMHLEIEYAPSVASMRQIMQAIAVAGFVEGLCEWRPGSKQSLSGSYGTWRLATTAEVEQFENGTLFSDALPNHRARKLKAVA
jgi:hypothetical protein